MRGSLQALGNELIGGKTQSRRFAGREKRVSIRDYRVHLKDDAWTLRTIAVMLALGALSSVDRVLASEAKGRAFESRRARAATVSALIRLQSPALPGPPGSRLSHIGVPHGT